MTIPNVITILRLCLIPVFTHLFLIESADSLAVGLLAFIGISDFADGFIARRFNQTSKLGKILDPLADRLAVLGILAALTIRDKIPLALSSAILARDILVLIATAFLLRAGHVIEVNLAGKTATAALYAGSGLVVLSVLVDSDIVPSAGLALMTLGAVLYWIAAAIYAKEFRVLRGGRA